MTAHNLRKAAVRSATTQTPRRGSKSHLLDPGAESSRRRRLWRNVRIVVAHSPSSLRPIARSLSAEAVACQLSRPGKDGVRGSE